MVISALATLNRPLYIRPAAPLEKGSVKTGQQPLPVQASRRKIPTPAGEPEYSMLARDQDLQ